MNDLTEKLNAGRLYYVKKKNGKIVIRQAHLYSCLRTENATPYVDFDDNDIEKVLAPVPSYNEVQALKEENARLKKLLQQWQEIHKHMVQYHGYINHSEFHPTFIETEKFIDEVLK